MNVNDARKKHEAQQTVAHEAERSLEEARSAVAEAQERFAEDGSPKAWAAVETAQRSEEQAAVLYRHAVSKAEETARALEEAEAEAKAARLEDLRRMLSWDAFREELDELAPQFVRLERELAGCVAKVREACHKRELAHAGAVQLAAELGAKPPEGKHGLREALALVRWALQRGAASDGRTESLGQWLTFPSDPKSVKLGVIKDLTGLDTSQLSSGGFNFNVPAELDEALGMAVAGTLRATVHDRARERTERVRREREEAAEQERAEALAADRRSRGMA